jgi:peroxiredoxin
VYTRQLPLSSGAPRVGQAAPDFTLTDQDGNPVTLSNLLRGGGAGELGGPVLLIFYRGYW